MRLPKLTCPPRTVWAVNDGQVLRLAAGPHGWAGPGIRVETTEDGGGLAIRITGERAPLERVALRWQGALPANVRLLGDHWERGYGDLEWRGLVPERVMPWYVIAWDGRVACGFGVKTQPGALCFWQVDQDGITLWLDVRNGGSGVILAGRTLAAATVVQHRGERGASPFAVAQALCGRLCDAPRLARQVVYGGNNWYYAYGDSDHQRILEDTELLTSLAPVEVNRPGMVIDAGWQARAFEENACCGAPWDRGNSRFPDLPGLAAAMRKLGNATKPHEDSFEASDPASELNLFPAKTATSRDDENGVSTSLEFPDSLIEPLETALEEAECWLVKNQPAEFREALLALYFRLHSFRRTAELYDERFVTIIKSDLAMKVRLFCLDPSLLLRKALARGKAAIFFSATLTPVDYYRTLLGGAPEDHVLQLSSPFPSENLAVLIQDRIQTNFKGRTESLGDVVEAIGTLVQGRRGNYFVYFPSYQYLNDTLQAFQIRYSSVPVLVQRPGMTEAERDAFLAAFSIEHGEMLVGFAVLGGIFGEGIDLAGERLIGAVIVGVGLPQLSVERNLIRDYFQQRNAAGFEYAYTFPGMNRVLQAIGRVIRSETDHGLVLLIDARFNETRYRRLFPSWWKYLRVRHTGGLREAIGSFWQQWSA